MADRFPLIVNELSRRIEELLGGDNLNMTGSGIAISGSTGNTGQYLKSDGLIVAWDNPGDVYLTQTQTLTNKTFDSCVINGSVNTVTDISNASLINSAITVNGQSVSLGGTITTPDTTYSISAVDGASATDKVIRLTDSGATEYDVTLVVGSPQSVSAGYKELDLSIDRSGNFITFSGVVEDSDTVTRLQSFTSGTPQSGDVTIKGAGGATITQNTSTKTILIDTDNDDTITTVRAGTGQVASAGNFTFLEGAEITLTQGVDANSDPTITVASVDTITKLKGGASGTLVSGDVTIETSGTSTVSQNGNVITIDADKNINTITRLKGGASGTLVSGDVTLVQSGATTISQTGQDITVSSQDTITRVQGGGSGTFTSGDILITGGAGGNVTVSQSGNTVSIDSQPGLGATNGIVLNTTNFELKNAGSLTDQALMKWDSSNGQLINSVIQDNGTDVTISGNLVVNGTTSTFNVQNISIDDKALELAAVATVPFDGDITQGNPVVSNVDSLTGIVPGMKVTEGTNTYLPGTPVTIISVDIVNSSLTLSDDGADTGTAISFQAIGPTDEAANDGGLILKGTTVDKTILYDNDRTDKYWVFSENLEIKSNKHFAINNVEVLSSDTLGTGVINSSLTGVGTLTELEVSGDVTCSGTGYIQIPAGTDNDRPNAAAEGMLRWNDTSNTFEGYNGSAWGTIGGGRAEVLSAAPSTNMSQGDLYWDTDDGKLYIYYDDGNTSQWVDASPYGFPTDLVIEGTTTLKGTLTVEGIATFQDAANFDGDLTVNTDAFFVDASAGNVGIGTIAPTQKLDVRGAIRFGSHHQYYGLIDHDAYTGYNSYISQDTGGHIFKEGSTERMRIDDLGSLLVGPAGAPATTITAAGVIDTTSYINTSNNVWTGERYAETGEGCFIGAGGQVQARCDTGTWNVWTGFKDGYGTGNITSSITAAGVATFAGNINTDSEVNADGQISAGTHLLTQDGYLKLTRNAAVSNNILTLNSPTTMTGYFNIAGSGFLTSLAIGAGTWDKCSIDDAGNITTDGDLVFSAAGKGVCLGVTSNTDANTLDDYEEGTFTPTLYGTTGSAGSEAYLYTVGQYTKIGRLVHARFQLVKTNLGSWTGDLRIGGMPFAALATTAGSLSLHPSANVDAAMRGIHMNGGQSYASITSGAKLDVLAPYSEIVTGYYLQAAITYNV